MTIVIPSKNEGITLFYCLYHISRQEGIKGTRVIVADSSTEEESKRWLKYAKNAYSPTINVETTEGGYPAKARLEGSKMATTELILFLDADMWLTEENVIAKTIKEIDKSRDLVTTTVTTDPPYNPVYQAFHLCQLVSQHLLKSPFALGGFQLWRTEAYWKTGGYDPRELFAEDYSISRKADPKRFKAKRLDGVYTSARRFQRKGVLWMIKVMVKSYLHRNDPEFFRRHHGYWD